MENLGQLQSCSTVDGQDFLSDNVYYCIVFSLVSALFVIVIHIFSGKKRGDRRKGVSHKVS